MFYYHGNFCVTCLMIESFCSLLLVMYFLWCTQQLHLADGMNICLLSLILLSDMLLSLKIEIFHILSSVNFSIARELTFMRRFDFVLYSLVNLFPELPFFTISPYEWIGLIVRLLFWVQNPEWTWEFECIVAISMMVWIYCRWSMVVR